MNIIKFIGTRRFFALALFLIIPWMGSASEEKNAAMDSRKIYGRIALGGSPLEFYPSNLQTQIDAAGPLSFRIPLTGDLEIFYKLDASLLGIGFNGVTTTASTYTVAIRSLMAKYQRFFDPVSREGFYWSTRLGLAQLTIKDVAYPYVPRLGSGASAGIGYLLMPLQTFSVGMDADYVVSLFFPGLFQALTLKVALYL